MRIQAASHVPPAVAQPGEPASGFPPSTDRSAHPAGPRPARAAGAGPRTPVSFGTLPPELRQKILARAVHDDVPEMHPLAVEVGDAPHEARRVARLAGSSRFVAADIAALVRLDPALGALHSRAHLAANGAADAATFRRVLETCLDHSHIEVPLAALTPANRHLALSVLDATRKEVRSLTLDASRCGLTTDTVRRQFVERRRLWSKLTRLELKGNRLDGDAATLIAEHLLDSKTATLGLSGNDIGDDGAEALAHAPGFPRLRDLDLSSNAIEDDGAAALGDALPGSALVRLDLGYNPITGAGVAPIGRNLSKSRLEHLNLSCTWLEDDGGLSIARGLPGSALSRLELCRAELGEAAAWAIGDAVPRSRLTFVDIRSNGIGDAARAHLRRPNADGTTPTLR